MRGTNPKRRPVKGDGITLSVQEIFSTIQGEGMHAGMPAIFIRLGGCNLACSFCDTEFESFTTYKTEDIVRKAEELSMDAGQSRYYTLAVLTGGEPLRQPIERLCAHLLERGFAVQVETNGTLYRPLPEGVDIVCSPKNTGRGYMPLRPDILERISALKFIISAHDALYREIGEVGQEAHAIPVYIQPMDEQDEKKNRENLEYAVNMAQQQGYKLSLQEHKIMRIP